MTNNSAAIAALWSEPMAMLGEFHQKDGPSVIFTFECLAESLRSAAVVSGKKAPAVPPPTAVVSRTPIVKDIVSGSRSRASSAMGPLGATPTAIGMGSHSLPHQPQSLRAASLAVQQSGDLAESYHRVPSLSTSSVGVVDAMTNSANQLSPGGAVSKSIVGGGGGSSGVYSSFIGGNVAASVVTPAAAALLNDLSNCAGFHSRTLSRNLSNVVLAPASAPTTTLPKSSGVLDWVSPSQSVASTLPRGSKSGAMQNSLVGGASSTTVPTTAAVSTSSALQPGTQTATAGNPAICGGTVTRTQLVCSDMLFGKNIVSGSYLRKEVRYKLQNVVQRATNGGFANAISIFTDANIGGVASLSFNLFDIEARGEKRPMLLLVTHPDPRELVSRMSLLGPYLTALAVDISAKSDEIRQAENTNAGTKSSAQKKTENYHSELRVAGFNGLLRTLRRELHDFFDIMLPATLSADSMGLLGTLLAKSKLQQVKREAKRLSMALDAAKDAKGSGPKNANGEASSSKDAQALPGSGTGAHSTFASSYMNDPSQFDVSDPTPACQRTLTERAIQSVIVPPFIARTDPQVYKSAPSIFIDMSSVAPPEVVVSPSATGMNTLCIGSTSDNTPGASGAASCEPSATGAGFQRIGGVGAASVSAVLPSVPAIAKVIEDAPIPRPPIEEQDLFIETLQMEMNMLTAATAVTFQLQAPQRAPHAQKGDDHHKNKHFGTNENSPLANTGTADDADGSSSYSGSVGGGEERTPQGAELVSSIQPTATTTTSQNSEGGNPNDTKTNATNDPTKLIPSHSGNSTRRNSLASVAPLLPPQSYLPVQSEDESVGLIKMSSAGGLSNGASTNEAVNVVSFKSYHLSAPEASRALYHRFPCANVPPPKPLSANPSDYTPLHLLHREQRTRCVVVEVPVGSTTEANGVTKVTPLAATSSAETSGLTSPISALPPLSPNPIQVPSTPAPKAVLLPTPSKCGMLRNRMKELRLVSTAPVRPFAAWLLDAFWVLRDNLYAFRTSFAPILTAVLSGGKVIVAGERAVDLTGTQSNLHHNGANGSEFSDTELLQFQETAASLAMSLTNLLPHSLQKTQLYCGEDDIVAGPCSNIQSLSAEFMRDSTIVQTSILSSNKQFVLSQLKPDGIVFVSVKPAYDLEFWEEEESDNEMFDEEDGGDDSQSKVRKSQSKSNKPSPPLIRFPPCVGNVTNVDELYYKENPQEAYAKKALNEQAFNTAWRHHAASMQHLYPPSSHAHHLTTTPTPNHSNRQHSDAFYNQIPSESVFGMQPAASAVNYLNNTNLKGIGGYGGSQAISTNVQSTSDFVASSEWRHRAPPPSVFPFNTTKDPTSKDGRTSWRLSNSLEVMEAYGRKVYPTLVVDIIEKTIQMGTLIEQSIKSQQRRIFKAIQMDKVAKRQQQHQTSMGGNTMEDETPIKRSTTEAFESYGLDSKQPEETALSLEEDVLWVQLAGITDLASIIDSTTEQCRKRDVKTDKAHFEQQAAALREKRQRAKEERLQKEKEKRDREALAANGKSAVTRRTRSANAPATTGSAGLSPSETIANSVKNTSFSDGLAGDGPLSIGRPPLTPRNAAMQLSSVPPTQPQQQLLPNFSEFAPNEVYLLQLALESAINEAVSRGRLYLELYSNLQYDLISSLERGGIGSISTKDAGKANFGNGGGIGGDLPIIERGMPSRRHHRSSSTIHPDLMLDAESAGGANGAAAALSNLIPEMPTGVAGRDGAIAFAVANDNNEGTYGYRNVSHIDAARVAEAFSNTGSLLGKSSKLSFTGDGAHDKRSRSVLSKIPVLGQFFKGDRGAAKGSELVTATKSGAKNGDDIRGAAGGKPLDASPSNTTKVPAGGGGKQKELGDGFDFIRKEIQSNPKLRMVMKRWRYGVADDEVLCFLGSVPSSFN